MNRNQVAVGGVVCAMLRGVVVDGVWGGGGLGSCLLAKTRARESVGPFIRCTNRCVLKYSQWSLESAGALVLAMMWWLSHSGVHRGWPADASYVCRRLGRVGIQYVADVHSPAPQLVVCTCAVPTHRSLRI